MDGQFHTKEMLQESGKEKAVLMQQQNETLANAAGKNKTKLQSRMEMLQGCFSLRNEEKVLMKESNITMRVQDLRPENFQK